MFHKKSQSTPRALGLTPRPALVLALAVLAGASPGARSAWSAPPSGVQIAGVENCSGPGLKVQTGATAPSSQAVVRSVQSDLDGNGTPDLVKLVSAGDDWSLIAVMRAPKSHEQEVRLGGFPGPDQEWRAAHPVASLDLQILAANRELTLDGRAIPQIKVPRESVIVITRGADRSVVQFVWDPELKDFATSVHHLDK